MLSNYYTLRAVTQEISGALKDSRCASIYCFRKDELRLHFSNGATVVALLRPVQGALYVSRNVERLPKKNVVTFFPELTDATVMAALISPTDREITMQFEHHELRLTFFGTPNALLIKDGEVIRSFKKSHNNDAKPDKERTARSDSGLDLLGKRLRKEYDASLSMNAENQFLKHLEHAKGAWIYDLHGQLLLSSIELTQDVSTDAPRHFESTSEAIRVVLAERERRGKFEDAAQEIIPKLKQSLDRTNRVLAEITRAETHTSRAEESLEIGKAILSALHTIERGASTVMLYLIAGEREIKLDPKLSAAENAERYFDRAHRSKSAQKELAERRTRLEEERAMLDQLLVKASEAETPGAIHELEQEFARRLGKSVLDDTRENSSNIEDPLSRFRQFTVAGGLRLLVGKSAAQNDDLTLHVAKKDDIWLHARGVKGSHGVLQRRSREKPVPKEAIEEAAAITAYFSDARTQSIAPVSYAEKKFVRKPRGASIGAVKMEREEVVMVRPGLPDEKQESERKKR